MKRLYRMLLRIYPASFREEYGSELERQFLDEYREAQTRRERARLGLRALADLAATAPGEVARELRQDLTFAARMYRQRPVATALALVALALAIGATTGVFSVVNALLLRGLPFRDADRLVQLQESPVDKSHGRTAFNEWRTRSPYLEDSATYSTADMNLSLPQASARAKVTATSASFFALLGVQPALGRAFAPGDDTPGRDGVAVIGHDLWQRTFGGSAAALGSQIRLNGAALTVVGIAPAGFDFPGNSNVWAPTAFTRLPRFAGIESVIGRLKPGLSMRAAAALFADEARRLNPQSLTRESLDRAHLTPLREALAGPVGRASLVMMGAVGFVLLIACANIAHLLLSRSLQRTQELTIRSALGASRARLVQQLITESLALTLVAGTAAIAVAHIVAHIALLARPTRLVDLATLPARLSSQDYGVLDWRVLTFAAGVAVMAGIVFGAVPARLIGRMLQSGDVIRFQPGFRHSRAGKLRAALIAMQAAFTVVLLAGSVTMGRSFLKLVGVDLGFRPERVVTLNVSLDPTRYSSDQERKRYYDEAVRRLRAIPGVESAGASGSLPLVLTGATISARFQMDPARRIPASAVPVTPGYFRALGTELLEGREFTEADFLRSDSVAVVNQDFARELGFKSGLSGRRVSGWGKKEFTIVGIVRTERVNGPSQPGAARLYYPLDSQAWPFITFAARTRGRPEPYLALCRNAVQRVDPQTPVYDVRTLGERLDDLLTGSRFYAASVLFLAILALLLAVVGIYGAATQSVTHRTHEIGVRIAIGAAPSEVRLMVLHQSLVPVAAGIAAGMAGVAGLGRLVRHVIENAQPPDAWTCGAGALVLLIAAALAVWTATRRVARMDPMSALRVV